ncbi:hypothetical protein MCUN1_001759 [Malassezia cuniculi]|uniref:Zinc transporter ZIP9 n=1 Tax=Malassezia cuniculi TaxID=948313 RepID=A0AAF0ETM4_9BASI|nr:hypothetical protein MCUN1_001759 [Malassezia cuniculi]
MTDGLGALVALGVAMAVGTFVTGCLPLFISLSRRGLRRLELWGSGLLIGAALTIVIPEGIASVYGSHRNDGALNGDSEPIINHPDIIAACLLGGFMLMFMIDKYSASHTSPPHLQGGELQTLSGGHHGTATEMTSEIRAMLSSMLGLLIHAAADGIAMGASSRSVEKSLRLVVALAIMVHKAPTSIGLCTLLMAEQYSKRAIRAGIFVFSLATPLSALLTYFIIRLISPDAGDGSTDSGSRHDIGAILTFSGGTFLFVAMHAVQHLSRPPPAREHTPSSPEHHHAHHPLDHDHPIHTDHEVQAPAAPLPEHETFSTWECILLVSLGTVTPKLLQTLFGAGHDHH